jgi:hypothetical protein
MCKQIGRRRSARPFYWADCPRPERALQLDGIPRAGFTGEEVSVDAWAVLEGELAATLLVLNHRAYTIRVRSPDESRLTLDRMGNTLLVSASGRTARYRS